MALEDYNWADRMVHGLAFGARAPQDLLCDLETRQFGKQIESRSATAPIFITALPRAGTTLLLEVLSRHPLLVTHSYRDMPFVLSPIMWRKLSGRFQVGQAAKERSHKDGLLVNVDSPEAFEEVLWLRHFPAHYSDRSIAPWSSLPDEFRAEFARHMRALIVSRGDQPGVRYLSKNNANIARLPALANAFPDARILVPLRHPLDHACSMLKQHERALGSQAKSRFVRNYTRDIGHFEFGANHRPIMFDGMEEVRAHSDPLRLDYWLKYWVAAHRHLQHQDCAEFIDMEQFTHAPALEKLVSLLGLPEACETMCDAKTLIRPISRHRHDYEDTSSALDDALQLYEHIRESSARLI